MIEDIYDPLDEYVKVFKEKFKSICQSTFTQLASESGVDVEENRRTCAEIADTQLSIIKLNKQITFWSFFRIVLCVILFAGLVWTIYSLKHGKIETGICVGLGCIVVLLILLLKINPTIKALKGNRENMQGYCAQLRNKAWKQMEPLNSLYDWDIFTRMMTQAVPRLEFDNFFTTQRLEELKSIYGWDESFNKTRSVLFSHSGEINGNPFVICRTKKMEWGRKEYSGRLTIHWTETVRGSDGKYHTQRRTQTLVATITRPYPEYHKKTRLIYGNIAAPDLIFTRRKNSHSTTTKMGIWMKKKELKRKARNLVGADYAMMSNEEFEVLFDSSDRNNNQQFALLFTPLAQTSILSLLNDKIEGYGDDFDFEKSKMINIISADHMQNEALDMNPAQYQNYNFDQASENFCRINMEHFRAIYFAFAPLLSVPIYQQMRSQKSIYGRDMKMESAYWEHEALANFWGIDRFKHPQCVTDCILKTKIDNSKSDGDSETTIKVQAYGYRAEPRLTYVEKFGGDGRFHQVPVHWQEYLPVTGVGSFLMKEDDTHSSNDITQTERMARIQSFLSQNAHDLYRRNISSRLYKKSNTPPPPIPPS